MNFNLTDEQRMLDDQLARLLAERAGLEQLTAGSGSEPGWSAELWAGLAELGLLALPFPEAHDGLGGGPVDIMLVAERMGRALASVPFIENCVLAPALLAEDETAETAELRAALMAGDLACTCAGLAADAVLPVATGADGDWRLSGTLRHVPWGSGADWLIVVAQCDSGPGIFAVAADAAGMTRAGYLTQDSRRAADITLIATPARRVAAVDPGARVAHARARATAAICAEAVGLMQSCLDQTVDYLRTREQFGVVIGKFQALQHQAADMVIALEQARSMAFLAAMSADQLDAAARDAALSAAKIQIDRSGRFIAQTAIQLHGGIGMTMELAIGHYVKRLTVIGLLWGDVDHHMDQLSLQTVREVNT